MARRVDPTQFVESTGKGFIDKKVFRRFISYYKPHIKLLLLDIIAIMTIAAVDLSYPQVLRYVINEAVFLPKQEAIRTMLLMLFVLFILYSIRAFGRYVSTAWGKIMGLRIETRMRKELFDKYHQLSFSYYDQHNTGDLMSRIISDL
ncbi:MAG: ABC transporter transmembrane domain-containing protein, partial [Coriobacteriia bacterium]|nr:ABC transporter transmembrane domain-containing protein [Coriobacteriia bacterium]